MSVQTFPPIPPPRNREDYICELAQTQAGLWILQREGNLEAFQSATASGLTVEEAMERLGGVLYIPGDWRFPPTFRTPLTYSYLQSIKQFPSPPRNSLSKPRQHTCFSTKARLSSWKRSRHPQSRNRFGSSSWLSILGFDLVGVGLVHCCWQIQMARACGLSKGLARLN